MTNNTAVQKQKRSATQIDGLKRRTNRSLKTLKRIGQGLETGTALFERGGQHRDTFNPSEQAVVEYLAAHRHATLREIADALFQGSYLKAKNMVRRPRWLHLIEPDPKLGYVAADYDVETVAAELEAAQGAN
jgi:hypothetical protein